MSEHPSPDTAHVYQNGSHPAQPRHGRAPASASTLETTIPHAYPGADDDEPVRPPWRFALCAAELACPVESLESEDDDRDDPGDAGGAGITVGAGGSQSSAEDRPPIEVIAPDEIDLLDLEEIVMWGLEAREGTFVHGRHPITGRHLSGAFASAERARAFFSRVAPLRVVYC